MKATAANNAGTRRRVNHPETPEWTPASSMARPRIPGTVRPVAGLEFQFEHGAVHVPALGLWLDAHHPVGAEETVFVSHAHSDHTAPHARVILSPPTRSLMRARVGGERVEHVLDFGTRTPADLLGLPSPDAHVTLLPAGHILGSAMILLEGGGTSLLYTGDFKLRPGLSAEPCEPRRADVLVMETTFGRPRYVFPPTRAILDGVVRFCREALDNEETPILLGYSLGKSQEILTGLASAELPIVLSGPVAKLTRVYESLGRAFPPYEPLDSGTSRGKVVLAPPGMSLASLKRRLGPCRVAALTGWAMDPGYRFQSQADAAFPLSDHADFPDLVAFVKQVAPRQVFTLHGFAADFAAHLRTLGFRAQALTESEQLELVLGDAAHGVPRAADVDVAESPVLPSTPPPAPDPDPETAFRSFAATCASIGAERSKLGKVRLLAGYLAGIPQEILGPVTTWLTDSGPATAAGWAVLRKALCDVAGVTDDEFRACYLTHSDTGETAADLLQRRSAITPPPLSLPEITALLSALATARGTTEKPPLLAAALRRCRPVEAKYLIKILTGNLRIGLKSGLVEEAVALAFGAEPGAVREAHQVVGDLGDVAVLARTGRLAAAGLIPFRPVRVMLASPEPDAVSLWNRVVDWSPPGAPAAAWIEDKFDGIRCQLHKVGARVALYSRDLKDLTASFPELAEHAAALDGDVVLDGELVAMQDGRALPFAELQRRLGRRERDLFLPTDVPVRFIAFDLLWHNGRNRWTETLRERRTALEALALPAPLLQAEGRLISEAQALEAAFAAARERGNEGLMIKDPASAYLPGRRGLAWFKWKRALATLDCVVVAAEYGHGRRKDVLSDYTFAIRDDRTGALRTIGKAYTGLTDAEIARLTGHFLKHAIRQRGRVIEVTPDVVLEIAFDALQESDRHDSGLAMRFPRIVRIRDDKTVGDIDTLSAARRLVPA